MRVYAGWEGGMQRQPSQALRASGLALSVTFGDSSPKGGALGRPGHFLLDA